MEFITNMGFGLGDIILLTVIILGILIVVYTFFSENIIMAVLTASFFALPISVVLYFYHIPDGNYLAQTIEKNGKVIGEGTYGSEKYRFDITTDKLLVDRSQFTYNPYESNPYVSIYTRGKSYITVTLLGYVRFHHPAMDKPAKIKVDY